MTSTAISVRGLTHTQGAFRLDEVDLELPTGLVMGFVGPNGAGKTTTIRALLGMLQPDAGSVELLDGQRPGTAAVNARVGAVLDQPFLSPDWKVSSLHRHVGRFSPTWDDELFRSLLDRFDVARDSRIGTLSRGQGVKVSLAVALAHHPELLVLDEPTSGLDPVSRADLVDLLRDFMVDERHSVLFSTHITSDLDSLADLMLVIDSGRIEYSGTLDELREEFAMVHGTEQLSDEAASAILGLRRTGARFDGLIHTASTPLFGPTTVIDAATTDDVVVHLARRDDTRLHQEAS
ncbi:ABC transporter ATP-binding protein [Pseudactinotalea suaedae]|uniref:ABC transporter ATP-binding protein n=1 Tax=Pseudactinotalea suaedae TaxID=1524924 RepID=UPI0012E16DDB|nr:ABC transporter ATP-binding protein [Pseudactinotalea suaedae]